MDRTKGLKETAAAIATAATNTLGVKGVINEPCTN
jgi:hypothetical protein